MYLTGAVRSLSRVRFHFRDSSGTEVADHLTYFSDAGCVVHQEPFDTTLDIAPGGGAASLRPAQPRVGGHSRRDPRGTVASHRTQPAADSCVVAHEPPSR